MRYSSLSCIADPPYRTPAQTRSSDCYQQAGRRQDLLWCSTRGAASSSMIACWSSLATCILPVLLSYPLTSSAILFVFCSHLANTSQTRFCSLYREQVEVRLSSNSRLPPLPPPSGTPPPLDTQVLWDILSLQPRRLPDTSSVLRSKPSICLIVAGRASPTPTAAACPSLACPKSCRRAAKRLACRYARVLVVDKWATLAETSTAVPCGPYSPLPETAHAEQRTNRCQGRCIHDRYPRIPHSRSPRACRYVCKAPPNRRV